LDDDLRQWLDKIEAIGELKRINAADWNLEIGCISFLNREARNSKALLFDEIKGYPAGYRVLTAPVATRRRLEITLNFPRTGSDLQLIDTLRFKLPEWERKLDEYKPEVVSSGPVLENVIREKSVDLLKFPTPKWNEMDGGRYIGTGCAFITRDPDSGEINTGTYRVMIHDQNTLGFHISPGKHGRIHYEKYHARREACPVAISIGHHPLVFCISCVAVGPGAEYSMMGAIRGNPMKVIKEEVTGLPVPADSEIVIAGFCPPDKAMKEGPFGEWTGYYASKERPAPIIEVERIYHRNTPIILGVVNTRPPGDTAYYRRSMLSALLHNELVQMGIPDIRGVSISEAGGPMLITVSLKQRYPGHAKQAALLASQSRVGGYMGRYVIVVDEDIDPTNTTDVLWALCTRSDPEKDIDIIRRAWSSPLDPIIRKPADGYFNTRAIIDATKPFEWMDEFPAEMKFKAELIEKSKKFLK
jgi:UbiD family decarboxylase